MSPVPSDRRRSQGQTDPAGAVLCLLSAAGFGAMAIFGKLAYDAGVSTLTLLFVRFALATAIFGVLLGLRPSLAASLRGAGGRALATGFGLGAIGYATQAGLFFAALQRLDASLLALVLYTYPAWVMLASFALGREQPTRRRVLALVLASAGLVILLAGASTGSVDAAGVAMGVGASLAYTAYILVADRAGLQIAPLALTALVCAGAACTFAIAGILSGRLDLDVPADGRLWLGLIAVVSTALPIVAFFAGLARVGPSAAAIFSTFEPVVTVTLAYLAFSEVLSGVQLAGAVLVLGAAVLLASPTRAAGPVPPD
jgi:drug/metabolite transporter (DMT)-like permease